MGRASRASRDSKSWTCETLGLTADVTKISSLIAALSSVDGATRHCAREALVDIGKPAVKPLISALADPSAEVRWEAAKGLGEIRDPMAIEPLIRALEDDAFAVRWLSAEGLIAVGQPVLAPLLQALMDRSYSVWFREGAHHVLRGLIKKGLRRQIEPVLSALDGPEPTVEVPEVAEILLQGMGSR